MGISCAACAGRSESGFDRFVTQAAENALPPLRLCNNAGMNPSTDPAMEEARRAGFDLNLIEMNLSLPPEERWRQHDMALEVILELEEARMTRDAKLQATPTTTR